MADVQHTITAPATSIRTHGSIYAIAALGTPHVKIGCTAGPVAERLRALQTGSPHPLVIIAALTVTTTIPLTRIEKQIHAFLVKEHAHGEWFATQMHGERLEMLAYRALRICQENTKMYIAVNLGILPGACPPLRIQVPQPDGSVDYVRYDCATWTDLEGALQEITPGVQQYDHLFKMEMLRPVLESFPARTVAEGCSILSKQTEP